MRRHWHESKSSACKLELLRYVGIRRYFVHQLVKTGFFEIIPGPLRKHKIVTYASVANKHTRGWTNILGICHMKI